LDYLNLFLGIKFFSIAVTQPGFAVIAKLGFDVIAIIQLDI
jgi:hypothetical protein